MKRISAKISVVPRKEIDRNDYDGAIVFIDDDEDISNQNIKSIVNKLILNVRDVENPSSDRAFSDEDALRVKEFIDNLVSTTKEGKTIDILCSCQAGVSRSPAMAASLLIYLTGPEQDISSIWDNHRYHPNRLIFRKMNAVLDPKIVLCSSEIEKRYQINRNALSREILRLKRLL